MEVEPIAIFLYNDVSITEVSERCGDGVEGVCA